MLLPCNFALINFCVLKYKVSEETKTKSFPTVPSLSANLAVTELQVNTFHCNDMSLVTRKSAFGVCDQVSLKPACSADETS